MKKLYVLLSILFSLSISAKEAHTAQDLTLSLAKTIASRAQECATKNKWNLSIAIVNSEGNLIYFERADKSYVGSIDSSIEKAKSSNQFQKPTSAFVEGLAQGQLGLLSVKGVVAIEGGVPIYHNGQHIGAIGISGAKSTEDELCAKFAIN